MRVAPIGVFGLIARTINQVAKDDIGAVVGLLKAWDSIVLWPSWASSSTCSSFIHWF